MSGEGGPDNSTMSRRHLKRTLKRALALLDILSFPLSLYLSLSSCFQSSFTVLFLKSKLQSPSLTLPIFFRHSFDLQPVSLPLASSNITPSRLLFCGHLSCNSSFARSRLEEIKGDASDGETVSRSRVTAGQRPNKTLGSKHKVFLGYCCISRRHGAPWLPWIKIKSRYRRTTWTKCWCF